MQKKSDSRKETSPSLVPLLEAEEKLLEGLLEAAKNDANALIESAKREASRRVKAAAERLADGELASPTSSPPLSDDLPSGQSQRTEEKGQPHLDKAVELILSKVWPGDES